LQSLLLPVLPRHLLLLFLVRVLLLLLLLLVPCAA
jgi:hypothetical protein